MTSGLTWSQAPAGSGRFKLGLIAGTQIQGKVLNKQSYTSISGLIGGLSLEYQLSKSNNLFSLVAQPQWTQLKRTDSFAPEYYREFYPSVWIEEESFTQQSLNIPLLVRYKLTSGWCRPFVEAGPYVKFRTGFLLEQNRNSLLIFTGNVSQDMQSEFYQDRFGVQAGVGVEFNLGKVTLPLALRLNEGFGTYQMKNPGLDGFNASDLKTSHIQFVMGISLEIP